MIPRVAVLRSLWVSASRRRLRHAGSGRRLRYSRSVRRLRHLSAPLPYAIRTTHLIDPIPSAIAGWRSGSERLVRAARVLRWLNHADRPFAAVGASPVDTTSPWSRFRPSVGWLGLVVHASRVGVLEIFIIHNRPVSSPAHTRAIQMITTPPSVLFRRSVPSSLCPIEALPSLVVALISSRHIHIRYQAGTPVIDGVQLLVLCLSWLFRCTWRDVKVFVSSTLLWAGRPIVLLDHRRSALRHLAAGRVRLATVLIDEGRATWSASVRLNRPPRVHIGGRTTGV